MAGAVVNDLQQIGPGLPVHGGHAPVVQQQDIGVLEGVEPARECAIGVPNAQLLVQAWHALIQGAVASPAGVLGQGASQPRLARAGGASDQHRVAAGDPLAKRQTHHRTAFQATCGAAIEVFDGRLGVFEFGQFEQACAAPVLSAVDLTVYQQGQAFFKAHGTDAALRELLLQCLGHGF